MLRTFALIFPTKDERRSPMTTDLDQRRNSSLVEQIQIENEETLADETSHSTKQTFSVFCSLTLHSLGIIYGDM